MPKVTVVKPFHFQVGADVKRYPAGKDAIDVPQSVADYAKANGFLAKEKELKPAPVNAEA